MERVAEEPPSFAPTFAQIYLALAVVTLVFKKDPSGYSLSFLVFLWTITAAIHSVFYGTEIEVVNVLQSVSYGLQVLVRLLGAIFIPTER